MKPGRHISADLSLLDKLLDLDGSPSDRLKYGLLRDIENLLNTMVRARKWPSELDALDKSLIDYGVKDFTTAKVSGKYEIGELVDYMRNAIAIWEPRLTKLKMEPLSADDNLTGPLAVSATLVIRVEAQAYVDGSLHEVTFDTNLDMISGAVTADG